MASPCCICRPPDSLLVALAVGVANAICLPIFGALSDRVGRLPVLLGFTILTILTAYPACPGWSPTPASAAS